MEKKLIQFKKRDMFLREQEEDDSDVKVDDTKNNTSFQEMVSILLHSQTQAHIFHLQTKSYSEHKALQNYYEGIDGLVDGVIEKLANQIEVANSKQL